MSTSPTPFVQRSACAALVAAVVLQGLFSIPRKSPVFDEPPHIAAGLSYLATGRTQANPQHPPLLKELSAVSMWLGGVRWPRTPQAAALERGQERAEWLVGNQILSEQGTGRVLFWARLPFVLLAGLLGFLIWRWGNELFGPWAALGALLLYALDPTIVAHSTFVTTDTGFACFAVLLFYALWRYAQAPSRKAAVWCGLALGAALCAKFSGAFLLPVVAFLLWYVGRRRLSGEVRLKAPANRSDPCPCGSGQKYKRCHGARESASAAGAGVPAWLLDLGIMLGLAVVVIEVVYLFSATPFDYFAGMTQVNFDHVAGHQTYFAGQLQPRFAGFLLLTYLLKEPLPAILLAALGIYVLLGKRLGDARGRLFVLLPPAALFLAYTLWAANLGVRYAIPMLPFLHLAGGAALAWLIGRTAVWARAIAIVFCCWTAIAAAGIYPDGLSYFNEAACLATNPSQVGLNGGTRCGPYWLDDSNVDWGQGLIQLRDWLQANAPGRKVKLSYFGFFPPAAYGIDFEPVILTTLVRPPTPGLYAISSHVVASTALRLGGGDDWLRRVQPRAIVGNAFYIYDIR